jgi:hypothetical protein
MSSHRKKRIANQIKEDQRKFSIQVIDPQHDLKQTDMNSPLHLAAIASVQVQL